MNSKKITFLLFFISFFSFSQINNEYLEVGTTAPTIIGVNQFDESVISDEILKEKQILLLFYRGNWCSYCKKHLKELQNNLEALNSKNVFVIVVTPEKVEKVIETSDMINAKFSIIHDKDNSIMNAYKVSFDVNEINVSKYFDSTLERLREYNEQRNNILPVPATYIINKHSKISYVHYNPNYKERASFEDILNQLTGEN